MFRTHIKNFATVSAPLTKLTRKDSGYNGGPLPKEALDAFLELKKRLMTDPVVAYPRSDRKCVLITDASTGTNKIAGGLGAILAQVDERKNFHAIAYGSRQLRDHETNYSPYLAEMFLSKDKYQTSTRFGLYKQVVENLIFVNPNEDQQVQTSVNEAKQVLEII